MIPTLHRTSLPECEIHGVLSNPRRRATISQLVAAGGRLDLKTLAEGVAEMETGQIPAPRKIRDSVYVSLQQTHLPKLVSLEVLEYDRETNEVSLLDRAHDLGIYMHVTTKSGFSWSECYRLLGIVGLVTVVAALTGLPLISYFDPLLWASAFLVVYSLSSAYHLWTQRHTVVARIDVAGFFARLRRTP